METVYYCWSCDAHRTVLVITGSKTACSCCGAELGEESRLSAASRTVGLAGVVKQLKRHRRPQQAIPRILAKGA